MYRQLAACVVSALVVGCGGGGTSTASTPAATPSLPASVDASTPDQALRAYWQAKDAESQVFLQHLKDYRSSAVAAPVLARLTQLTDERLFWRLPEPERFQRDILEVKVETPTRAVVLALIKNTTPIPEGAEVTDYARSERENGGRVKYVLSGDGKAWKVAEIWTLGYKDSQTFEKSSPSDRQLASSSIYGGL
mgnify:CR=1 FL=1